MSKNSKNARKIVMRKSMTAIRKSGGKGPAQTKPAHGKTRSWSQQGRPKGRSMPTQGGTE